MIEVFKNLSTSDKGSYLFNLVYPKIKLHDEPSEFKRDSVHSLETEIGILTINVSKREMSIYVKCLEVDLENRLLNEDEDSSIFDWDLDCYDGSEWTWCQS